ncbi:hypothetical protein OIE66_03885 [Nonomuraea sp. NBC_01738]|uniref:hypothetical protein n=1 Tax=Nonomuraea sp. NBC_01738 TaxID=2976003 RepID=UPI002E13A4ED|nr:hypothetical protein OIE66_03885 [Nonomuraea sp. NBC_01738]
MDKVLWVLQKVLDRNGGKMNGKTIVTLAVVAGVVVIGFVVFRLLMVETIVSLTKG